MALIVAMEHLALRLYDPTILVLALYRDLLMKISKFTPCRDVNFYSPCQNDIVSQRSVWTILRSPGLDTKFF